MRTAKKRVGSFPVVEMRLGSPTTERFCVSVGCDKPGAFDLALYGGGIDTYQTLLARFSKREATELAWERAYRMQQKGKEAWSQTLALCVAHARGLVEMYLGQSYAREIAALLVKAVTFHETIFLYDRNVRRDMHHPSIAVGPFQTIADFRRMYEERKP